MPVTSNAVQEVGDDDVSSDDGVHGPFGPEVGDAGRGGSENILAEEEGVGAGRETLSGEDSEEGRFTG
jgi:hypothetical protein